ncbi:MAG: hypothetical protein R3293_23945 [Candidatus Promineifilaceae bacterium]|nr:hypothetical protein [Candidatus Promineifilaceae bacterium]
MFTQLSDLKKAGLFYVLVMVLTTSVSLLLRLMAPDSGFVVYLHNLTPILATILMLYVFTRDGFLKDGRFSLGLRRSGWRYWGLALLLPLLVMGGSYGLAWISGAAELVLPSGSGWQRILFLDLTVGILVTSLFALSEEIGFRGYMLPRMLSLKTRRDFYAAIQRIGRSLAHAAPPNGECRTDSIAGRFVIEPVAIGRYNNE